MKNIHILPTSQPSRLRYFCGRLERMYAIPKKSNIEFQNIYITSDEEIKEGDWCYDSLRKIICKCIEVIPKSIKEDDYLVFEGNTGNPRDTYKKIILTTDQDLIKDGVQPIPDEFLEWFVKNPSCEEVEVKHKDIIQYGNMTMHDYNGDGSHYFCKDCEVETSRSKEELLKFGVEYYKLIIPKEELCSCTNKCIDNAFNICKGVKTTCIQCDGTGETTTSNTYNSQRKCDLCNGRGYWNKEIIPKEEPKQRLEKYSERFDNDKSAIGNTDTWGKRVLTEEDIFNQRDIDAVTDYIGKETSKQETLEEAAERLTNDFPALEVRFNMTNEEIYGWFLEALQKGAKWQQEQSYSEEEVLVLLHNRDAYNFKTNAKSLQEWETPKEWFEQFNKEIRWKI